MDGTLHIATLWLQGKKVIFLYSACFLLFALGFTNSIGLKSYYLDFELVNITLVVLIGVYLTIRTEYLSRLTYLDILVFLLPVTLTIHSWIFDNSELAYPGFYLGAIVYLLLRIEKVNPGADAAAIGALVVISFEIMVVLLQYFGYLQSTNAVYQAGGTFGHPSYSLNFIVLLFPFVVCWGTKRPAGYFKQKITLLIFALLLLAVILLQTRAAFIALILILCFQISIPHWVDKRIVLAGSLIFGAFIFVVKYKSSLGRLFVWFNTLQVVKDNILFGVGVGNFAKFYNRAQISFFQEYGSDNVFSALADYIQIPYNDYLLILAEGGLLLFALLGGIVVFSIQSMRNGGARSFAKYFLVFCLIACFWDVLFISPYTMLFFIYVYYANANLFANGPAIVIPRQLYRIVLATLVLIFTWVWQLEWKERQMIGEGNALAASGENGKAIAIFDAVFEKRKSDFTFSHLYVELLARANKFGKMKDVLNAVISQTESTTFKIILSRRLIEEGQYLNAESVLLSCYNNAPKYHYTHYMLTKLYIRWSRKDKADFFYKKILDSTLINPDMLLIKAELQSIYNEKIW